MRFHFFLVFCALIFVNSQAVNAAEFVQLNELEMLVVKNSIKNNQAKPVTLKAYRSLIENADALLEVSNFSVIDKTILAPTQNLHDYLSISRYWWPDESKPDGLPWTRRDGETNPDTQTDKVDRNRLGEMTSAVRDLGYAYYFSEDQKYAKKGTELIRAWFIDEQTRMNPHLEYAQSVPGIDKRRRSGILDGRLIPLWVLDSIVLFSDSNHWTEQDNTQMNEWLNHYFFWLTESKMGKSGAKQTNNHGSWYRFQILALAWYLQKDDVLTTQLELAKTAMAKQFNEQGAQEHELKRTRSFFYSCFNLDAITRTAIIADKAGQSMWDYPSKEESALVKAIEFLIPVAQGGDWPYPTKGIDLSDLVSVLDRYSEHSKNQTHAELLKTLLNGVKEKAQDDNREARMIENYALFKPSFLK